MKKYILIITILIFFSSCYRESLNQKKFDEAVSIFEKGDYNEALKIFSGLGKKISDWKIYYNAGNCYFKMGKFISAKIEYLRAAKLEPFKESIWHNIRISNEKLGISDKIDETFIGRVMKKLNSLLPLNLVTLLLIISIISLNCILIMFRFFKKSKKLIYGFAITFFLLISLFFYHNYRISILKNFNTGVVISKNSVLRSGPGESNTVIFKISPGVRVKILERNRDWYYVSESKNAAGWIYKDSIVNI